MIIDENTKGLLLTCPTYTPALIAVPALRTTTVMLRVDSLQPFKPKRLKFQAAFAGYEQEGTYLACVAFRVFDNPESPLEGDAYLNPRQEADRRALEYLTHQEGLPFVFVSSDLKQTVAKSISWQPTSREAASEAFQRSAGSGLITGSFDPEFQRVKERFQAEYSVQDLLSKWHGGGNFRA